jgi:large subunit ribosomal protein L15
MTKLSNLKPAKGATKRRKRLGTGSSSGHGGTCGRGTKGQLARSGGKVPAYFEGGQMPLVRRLPKRGFTNIFRLENQIVNVRDLNRFEAGSTVDFDALAAAGLVRMRSGPVKLLGEGTLDRALTVKVDAASGSARQKVEAAGGTVEVRKG